MQYPSARTGKKAGPAPLRANVWQPARRPIPVRGPRRSTWPAPCAVRCRSSPCSPVQLSHQRVLPESGPAPRQRQRRALSGPAVIELPRTPLSVRISVAARSGVRLNVTHPRMGRRSPAGRAPSAAHQATASSGSSRREPRSASCYICVGKPSRTNRDVPYTITGQVVRPTAKMPHGARRPSLRRTEALPAPDPRRVRRLGAAGGLGCCSYPSPPSRYIATSGAERLQAAGTAVRRWSEALSCSGGPSFRSSPSS